MTFWSFDVAGENERVTFFPAISGRLVINERPAVEPVGSGMLKLMVARRLSGNVANSDPAWIILYGSVPAKMPNSCFHRDIGMILLNVALHLSLVILHGLLNERGVYIRNIAACLADRGG